MTASVEIRESTPADVAAIEVLVAQGFPDEDLLPLVRDLLRGSSVTLSLVGTNGPSLIGHVIFTHCRVAGSDDRVALLGPVVIAPDWRRRDIGTTIIRAGMGRLEEAGTSRVFVLGDPAYYGRLGFRRESLVAPPYRLPPEWIDAWQSLSLTGASTALPGDLVVPRPWLRQELWAP